MSGTALAGGSVRNRRLRARLPLTTHDLSLEDAVVSFAAAGQEQVSGNGGVEDTSCSDVPRSRRRGLGCAVFGAEVPGRIPTPPGPEPREQTTRATKSNRSFSPLRGRLLRQHLTRARRALDEQRFGDAANELGALLTSPELNQGGLNGDEPQDFFLSAVQGVGTQTSLKTEAQRLLGQMPAQARELYELQYGAGAQALLGEAVRTEQRRQIERSRPPLFPHPRRIRSDRAFGSFASGSGASARGGTLLETRARHTRGGHGFRTRAVDTAGRELLSGGACGSGGTGVARPSRARVANGAAGGLAAPGKVASAGRRVGLVDESLCVGCVRVERRNVGPVGHLPG